MALDHHSKETKPGMNAPTTALLFVGMLLVAIGLFVAGSIPLIGLGIVTLFGAALFQALATRS